MRFDDSERLDKLESQMASVDKSLDELVAALEALTKTVTSKIKEYDNANSDKDRQFSGIRKSRLEPLESDSKSHADQLKKLTARVSTLEVQVKKLGK